MAGGSWHEVAVPDRGFCMSEEQGRFTIHLEQQEGEQINVRFDREQAGNLLNRPNRRSNRRRVDRDRAAA